jgi:hypothetical protein
MSRSQFRLARAVAGTAVLGVAVVLSIFLAGSRSAGNSIAVPDQPLFAPGPDGDAGALQALEAYKRDRVSYPTGRFSPRWLVEAQAQDEKIRSAVPAGAKWYAKSPRSPLTLNANAFTLLGPLPEDEAPWGHVSGRVNAIAIDTVDPTVAYIAPVGGGIWKTTNCCTAATTWTVTTDKPQINTTSVDDVTIDPNNHNTIYAATGDLNFGSFAMGSAGVLKSTDAGATWTVLGESIFNPIYPPALAGIYPQYAAVGKVRVDPNDSTKVFAGTKEGVYFSYDGGTNWAGPCVTDAFTNQRHDVTGMLTKSNGDGTTTLYVAIGTRGYGTMVQTDLGNNGSNGIYSTIVPASGCPGSWNLLTTPANGWPVGTGSGIGCQPTINTTNLCSVAANIALNPGMETDNAGVPASWTAAGDSTVIRDTTSPHAGAASLQISDSTTPGEAAADCVPTSGLGAYTGSFWYRTSAVAALSAVTLTTDFFSDGACGTANGTGSVATATPVATNVWTQVSGTVTPPAATGSVKLKLSFDCIAVCPPLTTVNYDDVSLDHGNPVGRIDLAMAPSNASVIYAEVQSINPQASCGNARGCFLGLWRTLDGGTTWTKQTATRNNNGCTGGNGTADSAQNWYNQGLAVDPTDPNTVWVNMIDVWKSTDGGATILDQSCSYGSAATTKNHPDQHPIAYVPGSSSTMLAGADGGMWLITNANTPTPTWTTLNDSLSTIEFYSGDISNNFANSATPFAAGGAQDNGSMTVLYAGNPTAALWTQRNGGDGFFARIEQKETAVASTRVFMESQWGNVRRSTTGPTGATAASNGSWSPGNPGPEAKSFIFPYEIDRFDCVTNNPSATTCDHIVAGSYRVWESVLGGGGTANWYINSGNLTKNTLQDRSYINALKYGYTTNQIAYVGTNDANFWFGFNLGAGSANTATWVDVTGGNTVLPNRPILDLTPSVAPADASLVAYAAIGGFNENTLTTPGHVFQVTCTANCASFTWVDKSGNLPNIPADSIELNPLLPKQAFVGTDWGLYFTNDITQASPTWYRFDAGLPHVMIWDMAIDRAKTTLAVFTRGRGAFAWPLPTQDVVPTAVKIASFRAAQSGRTVRIGWRTGAETQVLGYNVYRVAAGKTVKLNRALIAARNAGRPAGATYSFVDRAAKPGVTAYRLQLVYPSGKRAWAARTTLRVR